MLSFTIGRSTISVFLDGEFFSIDDSHANYQPLLDELRYPPVDRDMDAIRGLVTIKRMIERLTVGRITVSDTEVLFEGTAIGNYMAGRMIEIMNDGIDIEPYALFMDKVMSNPATYIRDELYQWMEKAKMPITPEGNFIAFKKVRADYMDCHTGKFDNSPGNILEMDRAACDANRHNHCSSGFHFCSPGYLSKFGGQRVVAVEIDPSDVTSIPSDYKYTKGRTCRYTVVSELREESSAHHDAWRKGVVDLENPAEFPAGVLAKIALPAPVVNAPVKADSDPADNTPGIDAPAIVYSPGDTVEVVTDRYHAGKQGAVSYITEDGHIWVALFDYGKVGFAPENIKLVEAARFNAFVSSIPGTTVKRTGGGPHTMIVVKSDLAEDLSVSARLDVANIAVHESEKARLKKAISNPAVTIEPKKVVIAKADVSDIDKQFAGMAEERAKALKAMVFKTTDGREFSKRLIEQAMEDASIRGAARTLGIGDSTLRGWIKKMENV